MILAMAGRNRKTLANEAWRELFDFIVGTVDHRNRVLQELGLTPNDSRALTILDAKRGRTMRSLAEEWRCDASTATWIVDRLVKRGLVLRRVDPHDRRITLVVLAAKGLKTRKQLLAGMYEAPPELLTLDSHDLSVLRDALAKLPPFQTRTPSEGSNIARPRARVL